MARALREQNDEFLFHGFQTGAADAEDCFTELVRRYRGLVRSISGYYCSVGEDAEDCTQDVFAKVFVSLGGFEGRSSFKTWLRRVTANHCLNELQKARRHRAVSLEDLLLDGAGWASEVAEPAVVSWEQKRRMVTVFGGMSEALREPLMMKEWHGLSIAEIALRLGIGDSAVKMRLLRARRHFRESWSELDQPMAPA